MKMLPLLVLLLGLCPALNAQVAENSQITALLKNASLDSVQKTERLASILFHEKINAHRVANKMPRLAWDDTLWLTARNHNIWMVANDNLDHHQTVKTKSFTGVTPGDRYDFASKGKGSCSWSGENVLYNYASGNGTIAKNAEHIAQYSFNQWKNSPGHNKNMLSESSKVHGVAFHLDGDGGRVWATDIFARQPSYALIVSKPADIPGVITPTAPTPIVSAASPETKTVTASTKKGNETKFVSASAKYVKLDLNATTSGLENALYSSAGVKKNKALSKAAQRHAEYMAANQKVVHDEKKQKRKYYAGSPHKRIVKASRGAKLFHKRSTDYVESIAMIQADAAAFDINNVSKSILLALDKEKTVTGGTTKAVGFGMVIKRVKNELRIYVVREEKSSQ